MTCDQAREHITDYEDDQVGSESVRLHLESCPACSALHRYMHATLAWFSTDFLPMGSDLTGEIMEIVRLEPIPVREPVSFRQWLLILLVMITAMAVSPIGSSFIWLQARLGQRLLVPLFLTLGLAVTLYCGLFIASHLDDLSERWGLN